MGSLCRKNESGGYAPENPKLGITLFGTLSFTYLIISIMMT